MVAHMSALEGWMAPIFAKAPHLPESARKTLVDIAPWLALIFGVLGMFAILSAGFVSSLFLGAFWSTFAFAASGMMLIMLAISFVSSLLLFLAYSPLSAHNIKGWKFLFYSTVLSAVTAIFNLIFTSMDLGQILGILIGFWILFEIRGYYKA